MRSTCYASPRNKENDVVLLLAGYSTDRCFDELKQRLNGSPLCGSPVFVFIDHSRQRIEFYSMTLHKTTVSPEEDKQFAIETSRSTSSDDIVRQMIIVSIQDDLKLMYMT